MNAHDHNTSAPPGVPYSAAGGPSRRSFLAGGAAIAVAATLKDFGVSTPTAEAAEIGPLVGSARADAAQKVRTDAAAFQRAFPLPAHLDNGDEGRYSTYWGNYTKALPHDNEGIVDSSEYSRYLAALASGSFTKFEALAVGARKLVDPLAAYAYGLEGADSHAFSVPPPPAAASAQTQGEMAELYWMALSRDIPFDSYSVDGTGIIAAAANDLTNGFSNVQAPKVAGSVTVQSLFRDVLPDNLTGNFISQYLLQDVPYGNQRIFQNSRRRPAGFDRLTTFAEWLAVQRGTIPSAPAIGIDYRYLRNGRDLAEWVHSDFPAQAALNAARIIAGQGNAGDAKVSPGINDSNNPYSSSTNSSKSQSMSGFVTFGNQAFFDLVTRASQLALQAAWFQKWLVHRRLRPEEHGGRVESTLSRGIPYPVGSELLASLRDGNRLGRVQSQWGSYLLPSTFPEGSPTHPAYPSGHSTFVAAGVTMIKAFVDGTVTVANPVRVNDPNNGDSLTPISSSLTINGELDKLVMNLGMGRLFAGVHWRSDHTYGVRLGELVAIRALQDLARTYAESFTGWDLRRFDGSTVRITSTAVTTTQGVKVATTNEVT